LAVLAEVRLVAQLTGQQNVWIPIAVAIPERHGSGINSRWKLPARGR
jgi:hypothetical protein